MTVDFIGRQIRRWNRNLLFLAAIGFVMPAGILWLASGWIYNAMFGPFAIDPAAIVRMTNVDQRRDYFVTFESPNPPIDTGMRESTNRQKQRKYVLIEVEDRFFLAILPIEHPGHTFAGVFQTTRSPIDLDLIRQIKDADRKMGALLLPFHFEQHHNLRQNGYFAFITAFLVSIPSIWTLVLMLYRMLAPRRHPLMRKLAAMGDVNGARASINSEIAGPNVLKIGRLIVTPSWLLSVDFADVNVVRLEDVVWAHKLTVRGQGASVQAVIYSRGKTKFEVVGTESQVNQMLHIVADRLPWVSIDYTQALDSAWSSNPDEFVSRVDEARRRYRANPPGPISSPHP